MMTRFDWKHYLAVFVAFGLLGVAGSAEASPCSQGTKLLFDHFVTATGKGRAYSISFTLGPIGTPCADVPVDTRAGEGLRFTCAAVVDVGSPTPTNANVYAYLDNVAFGSPGSAGFIFNESLPNLCDATGDIFDRFCTSDGVSGSSARFGFLRIVLRVYNFAAGVVVFDVNSDSGGTPGTGNSVTVHGHAAIRCDPTLSVLGDGNPTSSPSVYVGGDTFRLSAAVNAAQYSSEPANPVTPFVTCAPNDNNGAAFAPGTATTNTDFVLKGGPLVTSSPWPDDCSLVEKLRVTVNATTTGFTTTKVFLWNPTTLPSGASLVDDFTVQRTTKNLDRTLSPSGTCVYQVDGSDLLAASPPAVNRGESVMMAAGCDWKNARAEFPPNTALSKKYLPRFSAALNDVTDFGSWDATFNSSGDAPSEHTAATTATVTTGRQYAGAVEQYGASRTSAELYNSGRDCSATPCRLDVSNVYTWTDIFTNTTMNPAEDSVFVIGSDTMDVQCRTLRGVRGQFIASGVTTLEQKNPTGVTRTNTSTAATDSVGNSSRVTLDVVAPRGAWTLICTATKDGNVGVRTETVEFVSALTSFFRGDLSVEPVSATSLRVFVVYRVWDVACDCVLPQPIDDNLTKLTVQVFDSGGWTTTLNRSAMGLSSQPNSAFVHLVNVTAAETARPIYVFTTANVSMVPLISGAYFTLPGSAAFEVEGSIETETGITSLDWVLVVALIASLPWVVYTTGNPLHAGVALAASTVGLLIGLASRPAYLVALVLLYVAGLFYSVVAFYTKRRRSEAEADEEAGS